MEAVFFDGNELAEETIRRARLLLPPGDPSRETGRPPIVCISLDELINERADHKGEISFSRLFSFAGEQRDYTGRPGKKPLAEQFADIRTLLEGLHKEYGVPVPVVLLEDNVRHARMLNWVIDRMEDHGIFDHGRLGGISTCFCSASQTEREAIRHRGAVVPLIPVVDFGNLKTEVITPRDLLFDGFVVELDGRKTRLPGLFMDTAKMFKIDPEKETSFKREVLDASISFCESIRHEFGIAPPVSWFATADAVCHAADAGPETPMANILKEMRAALPREKSLKKAAPVAASRNSYEFASVYN
jgi:hypothetical protein